MTGPDRRHRREQRVRYYECDAQRVVHNAVYLAWCDDLADEWFRQLGLGSGDSSGSGAPDEDWDVMVKRAEITWSASARVGDRVSLGVEVGRWGNTSFELRFTGAVGDVAIFEATITYVAVRSGPQGPTGEAIAVPASFRAAAS